MSDQGESGTIPPNASKVSCRNCDNKVTAPALRLAKLTGCPVCGASPYVMIVHDGVAAMKAALRQLGLPEETVSWPAAQSAPAASRSASAPPPPRMGGAAGSGRRAAVSAQTGKVPGGAAGTRYLTADGRMAPAHSTQGQEMATADEDVDVQNMSPMEYAEYVRVKMAEKKKRQKIVGGIVGGVLLLAGIGAAVALGMSGGGESPTPNEDGTQAQLPPGGNQGINAGTNLSNTPEGTQEGTGEGDASAADTPKDPKKTDTGNGNSADEGSAANNDPKSAKQVPAPKGLRVDGLRESQWTFFAPGGAERARGEYSHGKRQGEWTFTNPDGSQFKSLYKDGRLTLLTQPEIPAAWLSPGERAWAVARSADVRVAHETMDHIDAITLRSMRDIQELSPLAQAVAYHPLEGTSTQDIRVALTALIGMTNLRHIELNTCRNMDAPDFEIIAQARTLQSLTLRNVQALNAINLSALKQLPELRRLSFVRCGSLTDDAMVPIGQLQKLQQLHMDTCPGLSSGVFIHLAHAPQLEEVELQSRDWIQPNLSDRDLEAPRAATELRDSRWLNTLATLPALRILRLVGAPGTGVDARLFGPTDAGLAPLAQAKGLEELYLRAPDYSQLRMEKLSELPNLMALTLASDGRSLTVDETRACMKALAGMPNLVALAMKTARRQQVSYLTPEEAAALGKLEDLHFLDLDAAGLPGSDLVQIKTLTHLEALLLTPQTLLGETLDPASFLDGLSSLRYVSITEWLADAWKGDAFKAFGALPELNALHVSSVPSAESIVALNDARRLKHLLLPIDRKLKWESFARASLESLSLGCSAPQAHHEESSASPMPAFMAEGTLAGVARITSLKALRMRAQAPGDALASQIASLKDLEYLSLNGFEKRHKLTSLGAIGELNKLRALNLNDAASLTNDLAREIAKLKNLEALGLAHAFPDRRDESSDWPGTLDDSALYAIASLQKLARIDLRSEQDEVAPFSGQGLAAFADSKTLREAWLSPYPNMRPWDYRKLARVLPQCRVRVITPAIE